MGDDRGWRGDRIRPRDPATWRRPAHLLALLVVPWSVALVTTGYVTLVFPWGLVTPENPSMTTIYGYLFVYTRGLPAYLRAWPASVGLYVLGLVSAAVGVLSGWDDRRLTAGLLALAGVAQVSLAVGFSAQPDRVALPTGTLALWVAAWWYHRGDARDDPQCGERGRTIRE